MNELLSRINETFDNCMANSNDDTKLQLRILKNNINALFNEYSENSFQVSTPINNEIEQELIENDFEPNDVEFEPEFEIEEPFIESSVVEEPIKINEPVMPIPEPINSNDSIPSIPMPEPVPMVTVQPTMQEAFSPVDDKHSILIVDDSSIVRNYLERVFSDSYNVHMAVDGKDAIDKISDDEFIKKISLIILDLMMPNIDGFGVLEYISGRQLNVPIMIISGDNSKETINRAFQYNVVDVIEKPFDAQKIKDKMDRFINL
jgi:CheY-like chemotaxis protein